MKSLEDVYLEFNIAKIHATIRKTKQDNTK